MTLEIDPAHNLRLGDTLLNAGTLTLSVGAKSSSLTISEYRLVQALFGKPNLLLSKEALMNTLFEEHEKRPQEGILRVYMHRVRARLTELGSDLEISTKHGIGWVLVSPPA